MPAEQFAKEVGMDLARLIVDLRALRANYRRIADAAPNAGAVVKADGYGLGAVRVLQALRREGCADFFVATLDEGIELRDAAPEPRIHVFSGPLDDADAATMAERRLTPVLNDSAQVERWRKHGRRLPAGVHVDTGMNRLGLPCDHAQPEAFSDIHVEVLLSHLANADDPSHPMNARQVERFKAVAARFPEAKTSLGNSAGALTGAFSDLPRPGIALYGGSPFAAPRSPMQVVATLEARVIALRTVGAGQPVGYGGDYVTDGETRIAVLGIGYADGIPSRLPGAEAAYLDVRLPVVARVSMDMMHVDASAVAERIDVGDWVQIFGRAVRVQEVAMWGNTIDYQVLSCIGARVRRCYVGEGTL